MIIDFTQIPQHVFYYPEDFKAELCKYNPIWKAPSSSELIKKWQAVIDQLNSIELIDFLNTKLEPYLGHPIISQPRIAIPPGPSNIDLGEWNPNSHQKDLNQISEKMGISCAFIHDGYIAGGAIANLINEFLFGVPAVINDIDYFYYNHEQIETTSELEAEIYEKGNSFYRIKKSYRDGLINFVEFESFSNNVWKELLNSFDLNCTMFAFHPLSKKILINPQSLDFLINRIIRINKNEAFDIDFTEDIWNTDSSLCSFSSIIRARRKSKELQAFFPFNDYIKKFIWDNKISVLSSQPIKISNKREKINNQISVFISNKDLKYLKTEPTLFNPYFDYQESNNQLIYQHPDVCAFNFFKQYTKELEDKDAIEEFYAIESYFRYYEPFYPLQDLKSIIYQRFFLLKKYNLITQQTKKCFKENILEAKLEPLSKLFIEHDFLKKIMDLFIKNYNWNFNQCCTFFLKLKNQNHLIGTLESSIQVGNQRIATEEMDSILKSPPTNNDFSQLINYLDQVYIKNKERNTLRNKENLKIYKNHITELTTVTELEAESRKMHHCVRGYSDKVRKGDCRIFHLKIKNFESTLELIPYYEKTRAGKIVKFQYRINQHTSHNNYIPNIINKKLANLFLRYLNLNHSFDFSQKLKIKKKNPFNKNERR